MKARKQYVMQEAQRLFIEKGFNQTSIQDIIHATNISKGTFYNYFKSKNECLIAILTQAQKDACKRRKELYDPNKKSDRHIFIRQIIVRMQVNREQNILSLLGFVFHSKDRELREFAKTYHLEEVAWISRRLIDIYGEKIQPYAVDCAVFLIGLSQQYHIMWSYYVDEKIDTPQLMEFILEKMDALVDDFSLKQRSFIHPQLFIEVEALWQAPNKDDRFLQSLNKLQTMYSQDPYVLELLEFIITELSAEVPRSYVIDSVMDKLLDHTKGSLPARDRSLLNKGWQEIKAELFADH